MKNDLALFGGDPIFQESVSIFNTIGEEEITAVIKVMESGVLSKYVGAPGPDFMGGPKVQEMEEKFAEYFAVKHAIAVNSWTIDKMSKGNNKKLRQSSAAGFNFRKLDLETFDSVYELLENNRKLKNANLSLTKEELYNLCAQFPEHYSLFGVYHGEILVSAAVVVVTYSSNLYVFYWADDFNYRSYSSVTFLSSELVKYASKNGYETLDLGTVGQNGTYNSSLARFKQNLGASLSLKYSLSLSSV
jgi:hypothetical protein